MWPPSEKCVGTGRPHRAAPTEVQAVGERGLQLDLFRSEARMLREWKLPDENLAFLDNLKGQVAHSHITGPFQVGE